MKINTANFSLTDDLLFVIRNVGRPDGFDRELWREEIDSLRERGSVEVVRETTTRTFLKFITA